MRALVWFRQQGSGRIYDIRPRSDGGVTAEPTSLGAALRPESAPQETLYQTADQAVQTDAKTIQRTADKAVQTEFEPTTAGTAQDTALPDDNHPAADQHGGGSDEQVWDLDVGDDGKLRMKYKGIIGLRHPSVNGGDGIAFEFPDRVSALLCYRTLNVPANIDCDKTSKAVAEVISHHIHKLANMRAWECQFCGKPAKEMSHMPIPFFNPLVTDRYFQPYIWDFVVPICHSLGECDRKSEALIVEVAKGSYPGGVVVTEPNCRRCGGVKNLLRCGRCKRVSYCSKACQAIDWEGHKDNCRLAQKEMATMEKPEVPPVLEQPKKKTRKRPNRKSKATKRKAESHGAGDEHREGTA